MKKKSIRILLVLIFFLTITSMQNKVQAKESFIRRVENDVRRFISVSNDTEINVAVDILKVASSWIKG